ncbi:MAG: AAA family ATPase [Actinobacteria bacterium]|nr:AAA family ATPase [Actinomycetota bacterium]
MRNPRILVVDRDETLAEAVREAVGENRPTPEVHICTKPAAVEDVLTEEGPFDILVAGPGLATRAGLARLAELHDVRPDMGVVLVFSRRPNAALRDIVRTGAVDILQLPFADGVLRGALDRVIEMNQTRTPVPANVTGASSNGNGSGPKEPGLVFTMSSATGGCGKTFLATNLAYMLSHYTGKQACVIDLDLQFGEVSTALRLRPKYTIFDALEKADNEDADLDAHIEDYLVKHESGFSILAAPRDPSEADRIEPTDVARVIRAVRNHFDYVVVDTPAALTEVVLAAFDMSDVVYTMATLDLPSVRNMGVFLGTLERLKISSENIRLILNKAERDVGIDVDQVTKLFTQGFKAVLPYAKEVSRSINVGMPVMASSPGSEISQLMLAGFKDLLSESVQNEIATEASSHRRFRLFRRAPALTTT